MYIRSYKLTEVINDSKYQNGFRKVYKCSSFFATWTMAVSLHYKHNVSPRRSRHRFKCLLVTSSMRVLQKCFMDGVTETYFHNLEIHLEV